MGWWSPTILGGDSPSDAVYDLAEAFGGYSHEWGAWDARLDELRTNLEKADEAAIIDFIEKSYEAAICAQVAALMHMACGAKLSPALRELAIQACDQEDVSCWNSPYERRSHLDEFSRMIRQYDDSTPSRPPEIGLFEALNRHLASKNSGILNDNL